MAAEEAGVGLSLAQQVAMRRVHKMSVTDLEHMIINYHDATTMNSSPLPVSQLVDPNRIMKIMTQKEVLEEENEREKRWEKIDPRKMDHDTLAMKLKTVVRRGIPEKHRPFLYQILSGSDQMEEQLRALYLTALQSAYGDRVPSTFFTVPTFGGHFREDVHCLSDQGIEAVKRLLCLLRMQNPGIDYVPQLPDLVGLLLLYVNEKQAFYIAQTMLDKSRKTNWFFNMSRTANASFLTAFNQMVARHLPDLAKHFETIDFTIELVSDEWFFHYFLYALPFQSVLFFLDTYMSEGCKMFLRLGLGIFKTIQRSLLKCRDAGSALMTIKTETRKMTNIKAVMQAAYGFSMSRQDYERVLMRFKREDESDPLGVESIHRSMYYRPKIMGTSKILNALQFEMVWEHLPTRFRILDACLIFDAVRDGYALKTLYHASRAAEACITLIQTTDGARFGCFTTDPWQRQSDEKYFGSRECFVFSISPKSKFYKWLPNLAGTEERFNAGDGFMLCTSEFMSLGSGGQGAAIWLDRSLNKGSSNPSETFKNEPLAVKRDFSVSQVEVFALTDDPKKVQAQSNVLTPGAVGRDQHVK
eukprot:TRINITY_DN14142_c0_g1_i1.p1 TRINITY_DN14142_c0_g1~~TRINITY_DN14142_c0_g1_i1.p1  ORF type:complete len:593 (-),score=79.08 TRINITY_DN14142_c0_g1_i1:45-1799(-)